jgi:hypothetical protein
MNFKDIALTKVNPIVGRAVYFALGFAVCLTLVVFGIV